MIDTKDLTSYIPGYDEYCEIKEEKQVEEFDYYEDYILEKEDKKVERKIIDLEIENLLFDDSLALENYVWKGNKLIPAEMIEGK